MQLKLATLWFFMGATLNGCTTLLSTSTSDIQPGNTNLIEAEGSWYGHFHLDTPEINIQPKLRSQCPNGTVNGVQTTLSVRNFLIVQKYTVRATGYCK